MRLVNICGNLKEEKSFSSKREFMVMMHIIGETYLQEAYDSRRLTTDMDGVLSHDDNAMTAARIIGGDEAVKMYSTYADLNIKAVEQGLTSYCWYAPTVFTGQLLKGLPREINRVIGRNMRLIPDAERYIECLLELGYDITAVTAAHQESAEEISRRVGITRTIGTVFGGDETTYDGTVERFIGGSHKLSHVREILEYHDGKYKGTHIGDSWSDVDTLVDMKNPIAFNPGCLPILNNARISIIGTSKRGLIPLFDQEGRYDSGMRDEELPRVVIVSHNTESDLSDLLPQARAVKKHDLEQAVRGCSFDYARVEQNIIASLTEAGIDYRTKTERFMPPEEFDALAKDAYERLMGDTCREEKRFA